MRTDGPPDYAWASGPTDIVPDFAWLADLPPLQVADPPDLPPAPAAEPGDLTVVAHRRIRNLAAYWHEHWPHSCATARLRPEAAQRLYRAADSLPDGFGLAVWDAWRDPALQQALHDTFYHEGSTLAPGYVSVPDPDPALCPPHASGGTVDLTLTWQHTPLALGTGFDAFRPEAHADALEGSGPSRERNLRRLLAQAMGSAGFVVLPSEWWHWEYGTRRWAAVTGEPVRYGATSVE